MVWIIFYSVLTLILWILTAFTLKGVDWILVSGVNMLPKEEKQKYREKHNVLEMNRYIGKRTLLPCSVWAFVFFPFMLSVTLFSTEWLESTWYGTGYTVVLSIISLLALVSIFTALPKILGSDFEKEK